MSEKTPNLQTWQEQEQWVREKYPDAEWVSQAEFDKRFWAAKPMQRLLAEVEFGIRGMQLGYGKLLLVTQNG